MKLHISKAISHVFWNYRILQWYHVCLEDTEFHNDISLTLKLQKYAMISHVLWSYRILVIYHVLWNYRILQSNYYLKFILANQKYNVESTSQSNQSREPLCRSVFCFLIVWRKGQILHKYYFLYTSFLTYQRPLVASFHYFNRQTWTQTFNV